MSRILGSGSKKVYVSFRTEEQSFDDMMAIGETRGLNKTDVYREAEEEYIARHRDEVKNKRKAKASKTKSL